MRILLILHLLFSCSALLAQDKKCPLGSKVLSQIEEKLILCEDLVPYRYRLINVVENSVRFFPIQDLEGQASVIPALESVSWDPMKLEKIKVIVKRNIENENQLLLERQQYLSLSLLERANNELNLSLEGLDPCFEREKYRDLDESAEMKHRSFLMTCFLKISNQDRERLGLNPNEVLTLLNIRKKLSSSSILLQSKSTLQIVNLNQPINPKDFIEYRLIVQNQGEDEVTLTGSCRQERSIQFNNLDSEKRNIFSGFENPLNKKIKISRGLDLSFPLNVQINPAGSLRVLEIEKPMENVGQSDRSDIDLDLRINMDVKVLGGYNLSVSPNIVLPISQNVEGIQDSIELINLNETLTSPKSVGIRFEIKF